MITKKDLKKLNDYLWEIPKSFRKDMRVSSRIYVKEEMLDSIFKDRSLDQLVNLATLPGIVNYSLVMPDVHEGYGSPIGGVFATRVLDGIISPGAVGYDINCGVRLLKSNLSFKEIKPRLESLATEIQKIIPSGLGRGREEKLNIKALDKFLEGGVPEAVRQGFGEKEDFENCEAKGSLEWADALVVSETAKNRGRNQLGTLGSGNHFLEIQKVEEIFDQQVANVFGLFKDQVVLMIHTGSRGLGHQVASDYIRLMLQAMPKYGIWLPDRELACAPFNSPEGQRYFKAMACAANFAWTNRQMITYHSRQAWEKIFGFLRDSGLKILYDVVHNIAKIEEHEVVINNQPQKIKLVVHRKGATRAFPPNHPEIPKKYQNVGQPVIIPGSMGTASYILCGTHEGKESFYSASHGAGRMMSRREASRTLSGEKIVKNLASRGIIVKCYSWRGIAEEAPQAYKDIDKVVEVVQKADLAKKVARLVPLAVIKGE